MRGLRKRKDEEERAPLWLMTLGDMSLLLLVFFILLVAIMSQDRTKYLRLKESLEATKMMGVVPAAEQAPGLEDRVAGPNQRAFERERAARVEEPRPEGEHDTQQSFEPGRVLTVGGRRMFGRGAWTLDLADPRVREELVAVKRYFRGRRNLIEIRGHTSADIYDSVVLEEDGRVRPFTKADRERPDWLARANPSLLSWLRANEIRKFFVTAHPDLGDPLRFRERQVRIRAESYSRTVVDSARPDGGAENRRVEVMATEELLRE